ncbi:MAG: glycosyltransferase family 4 protein [Hyphomicrobiales bacterium]
MGKKIAIILPYRANFNPVTAGGLEIGVFYQNKSSSFLDGITVYGGPQDAPYSDVPYQSVPLGAYRMFGKNGGLSRALKNIWNKDIPDMFEVHNRATVFMNLVSLVPDIPSVLYLHNVPQTIKGLKTASERARVLEKASAIVCCSSWVKQRFCEGLSGDFSKLHVVVNGVPRPWETPPKKEKIILFPNRLIKDKGTEFFAEALAHVLPRYSEWRCMFVGAGDEDVLSNLDRILKPLGTRAEVHGLMPYDEILDLFARSSIIGVPVFCDEAFGRTAAEALAAGAALIATNKGGLDDILQRAGICVEPTVESMADALEFLVGEREELIKEQEKSWTNFDYSVEQSASQLEAVRERLFEIS